MLISYECKEASIHAGHSQGHSWGYKFMIVLFGYFDRRRQKCNIEHKYLFEMLWFLCITNTALQLDCVHCGEEWLASQPSLHEATRHLSSLSSLRISSPAKCCQCLLLANSIGTDQLLSPLSTFPKGFGLGQLLPPRVLGWIGRDLISCPFSPYLPLRLEWKLPSAPEKSTPSLYGRS